MEQVHQKDFKKEKLHADAQSQTVIWVILIRIR